MSSIEYVNSITLSVDTSSVTFSSIPATYTDLLISVTGRTSRTTDAYEAIAMRFNGDSGSNYSLTYLLASGASAVSGRSSNYSLAEFGRFNASASSNTTFALATAEIMQYANTNINKTILGSSASSAEAYPVSRYVTLWRSTSAITSITFYTGLGPNFVAGSTFTLWGIK